METNWVTTQTKLGSTVHYKENHELSFGKNKTETPNYVFLFRSRENALESYQLLTGNSQQKSQHGILGTGNARPLNITWEWDDCKGSINVISNALRKLKDGLTARMTGATCLFSLCQVSKNGSSLLQGQAGVHLQARCRMAASSTTQYATCWPSQLKSVASVAGAWDPAQAARTQWVAIYIDKLSSTNLVRSITARLHSVKQPGANLLSRM